MTTFISTNPANNYEKIGELSISSNAEIQEKVLKANAAKKAWKEMGIDGRVNILKDVVNEIIKRKKEISFLASKEMGMPITQSFSDTDSAVEYFNWYLDNAKKYLSPEIVYEDETVIHKVFYEPIGTAAVIVPWNYPLSNFVWGAIQNLVAGNTVVFKHSEECPLFGKLLEDIMAKSSLPEGVFSEIYGDGKVGDMLVHQNIDLIWFTGSTKVGKYLYQVGSEKFIRVLLELGGSAPGLVMGDANIDKVLEPIYYLRFYNSGQSCDALKRLIVHESKFEELVEKLKKLIESKKVGNPEDESTDFGPLVAKRQVELLDSQVQDAIKKGAKLITGGKQPANIQGAFYKPTILTNITFDMRVWTEEVFGPVLPIVSFKTEDEAVKLANDTKYGLGSYIFSENKENALQIANSIDAGMVSINNVSYLKPSSPFGGYKESGLGREHGKFGFHELTQVKVVAMEK